MAAFNRPTNATYEVHEKVTVDTSDNEDHTFCGIMFPVKCKDLLPLHHLIIKSISVRGRLGPLTVWVSKEDIPVADNGEHRFKLRPKYWEKIYEKTHTASFRKYKQLVLDTPIRLLPGQVRAIYIHSTLPGDEAIVYDNSYYGMSSRRYEDEKLAIMTGRAHVSTMVFGQDPIWGWGNAWRDNREFVGRLEYGTVYKLWNPQVQPKFGGQFQDGVRTLFLCQRRWESPMSLLPDECIYYILNMCRWDWFNDNGETMRVRRKQEKTKTKLRALEAAQKEAEMAKEAKVSAVTVAKAATAEQEEEEADESSARRCCSKRAKTTGLEDEDEEMERDDDENSEMENEDVYQESSDDEDDDIAEDEWRSVDEEEDDDEEQAEDESSDEEWSEDEDQYHRANIQAFSYRDVDSDASEAEEEDDDEEEEAAARRAWLHRQFARVHVLRALASMEDGAVAHAQFGED